MGKIALVTGATSGIGEAVAILMAKEGYKLIITGRREDRLQKLASELKTEYGTETLALSFDIRCCNEVDKFLGNLPKQWQCIDILINNAGLAVGLNPVQDGVLDDWERMIDTNIKGLLYVTKCVSDRKSVV